MAETGRLDGLSAKDHRRETGMKDRHTLNSRGSSKPLHCRLGGWMLVSAEAWLMRLVQEHQLGASAGGPYRCGGGTQRLCDHSAPLRIFSRVST